MADESTHTVSDHFQGKDPSVRVLYDHLLAMLRTFGPVVEEPKKTSIHLVRKSALAGVETRGSYILLNLKADHPLESPRVNKVERVSANRIHHRLRLSSPAELDDELRGWQEEAYALSG